MLVRLGTVTTFFFPHRLAHNHSPIPKSQRLQNTLLHRHDEIKTLRLFIEGHGSRLPPGFIRAEPNQPVAKSITPFTQQYFSIPDALLTLAGGPDSRPAPDRPYYISPVTLPCIISTQGCRPISKAVWVNVCTVYL